MSTAIEVGSRRFSEVTFKDEQGALYDPPVVIFKLQKSDWTTLQYIYGVDPEVTRLSAGKYRCEWSWTRSGRWRRRWQGLADIDNEDTALASSERDYVVQPSRFESPILPEP
jgi:hypothetical protein